MSMTMHNGIVLQEERFKKAIASKDKSSYKVVAPGQLVVGFPIDEGVLYVQDYDFEGIMSPAYSVWDIDDAVVSPKYLELALHSPQSMAFYSEKLRGTTARRRSIPAYTLIEMNLPVPDKNRQATVVKVLGSIRSEIHSFEQLANRLDELIKSRFVEMFGDQKTNSLSLPTVRLGDVAFVGSSKRVFKKELVEEGVPFYRGTEVGALAFGGNIQPELFITEDHYAELIAHTGKPEIGDLLMPSICPDGQIWLVDTDAPFYFKDGRVLWVKPDRNTLDSTYLQHAMRNRFISDFDSFASGTTFAELKIFILKDLVIALPDIQAQQEFAAFVEQVDKLRSDTRQAIDKLHTLYGSLAQEYFGS